MSLLLKAILCSDMSDDQLTTYTCGPDMTIALTHSGCSRAKCTAMALPRLVPNKIIGCCTCSIQEQVNDSSGGWLRTQPGRHNISAATCICRGMAVRKQHYLNKM